MLRALLFLALVTLAAIFVASLIDRPGTVTLEWLGYRVETTAALLIAMIAIIAALTALTYRIILAVWNAPAKVNALWHGRRQQKGYQALTKGMVAIAAGDAEEARRQEKRAQVLLKEPPLTMLFSAQTAQLNGDEKAAERFFQAMTEQPDTEFLGVRGLLNQALNRGDYSKALKLAQRAHRLRPKSDWVAAHLFNLQIQKGLWLDAQVTIDEQIRNNLIDRSIGQQRKALLIFQQGIEMRVAGDTKSAAKKFKDAYSQNPTFIPSALAHANALIKREKCVKATEVIKNAWRIKPHPGLVEPFCLGSEAKDELAVLKATHRLVFANRDHPESLIALARAALGARLWGEARTHLKALTPEHDTHEEARVCRLWAKLEESENQDIAASQNWLTQASLASGDPAWICGTCGNAVIEWSVLCGNCGRFATLNWDRPRHVSRHTLSGAENNMALAITND